MAMTDVVMVSSWRCCHRGNVNRHTTITKTHLHQIINVSGTQFLVDFSVFAPYPDTLLGSSRLNKYYMSSREEYFLERQKHVFNSVIRFYTNDEELICPPCIPKHVFEVATSSFYHAKLY